MKCKYYKICKGYNNTDFCCQFNYEADGYCGHYKKLEELRLSTPLTKRLIEKWFKI